MEPLMELAVGWLGSFWIEAILVAPVVLLICYFRMLQDEAESEDIKARRKKWLDSHYVGKHSLRL